MTIKESDISLRAATALDDDFLMEVFASTREAELAALPDPAIASGFIKMQFDVQRRSYKAAHPRAENRIIGFQGNEIGRILVDYAPPEIRLVDISLLKEFRARGVGSFIIRALINEAVEAGKPLTLSVYSFNPALHLYERLGFSKTGEDGLYIEMRWDGDTQTRSVV
jgi:ribosomal protein S18 acetylase RimI-like enzyme